MKIFPGNLDQHKHSGQQQCQTKSMQVPLQQSKEEPTEHAEQAKQVRDVQDFA